MPKLKQGTLAFASTKHTKYVANGKAPAAEKKRVGVSKKTREDASEAPDISSDEDSATSGEPTIPAKRTRASTKAHISSRTTKQASSGLDRSDKQKPIPAVAERERLDVTDKAGRYRRYYSEVRSKMGHIEPVHPEGQNKIHQMLRFFDMSYEYGPCIGMTRLERWGRAEAFGLNPPVEVRDILLTKEGTEKAEYSQCVLEGEV